MFRGKINKKWFEFGYIGLLVKLWDYDYYIVLFGLF